MSTIQSKAPLKRKLTGKRLLVAGVFLGGCVAMGAGVGVALGGADDNAARQSGSKPARRVEARAVRTTLDQMRDHEYRVARPNRRVTNRPPLPGPIRVEVTEDASVRLAERSTATGSAVAQDEVTALTGPPLLLHSFPGLSDPGNVIPPDTQGAAGPSHLVTVLNSAFAIYDKTTEALLPGFPISLDAFWAPLGTGSGEPAENPFDPRILYDPYTDRFIIISLGTPRSTPSWLLVAVSLSADPTDGFVLYGLRNDLTTPGQWGDLPALGVDPDHIYVTHNMFTTDEEPQFTQSKFWVLDKSGPLAGGPVTAYEFLNQNQGDSWIPAHAFGPTGENYVLDQGWVSMNPLRRFLRIQRFSFPDADPVLTDLGFIEIPAYGFDPIEGAPQAGCGVRIETSSFRLQNAVFRDGLIWTTNSVDDPVTDGVARREIAYYGFDPESARLSGLISFAAQHGRVSDPGRWYYYPSIAVNDAGSVALGFSGSSSTEFAGAFFTARRRDDVPGTTHTVTTLKAGVDTYNKDFASGRNRWGDFSALAVDPTDGATFWTLQEYAESEFFPGGCGTDTGRWATWWGAFRFPACQADVDCDDTLVCNGQEFCDVVNGLCLPGVPIVCDDGDPCTDDRCEEGAGSCVNPPLPDSEHSDGPDGVCGTRDDNPDLYGVDGRCATLDDLRGDGVCDVLDNCPAIYNPGQEDSDGGAPGDACDCSRTVEVDNLRIVPAPVGLPITVLSWDPGGPEAATYDIYGALQSALGDIVCVSPLLYDPIYQENFEPDPGLLLIYLAVAVNSCGVDGTLGFTSAGIERQPVESCP